MKERCYNPNHVHYKNYGGRGISVCDRWLSLEQFVIDNDHQALPGTTIDRIENDGPYSPDNCRWATLKQQGRNRRNNRMLTVFGQTKPLIVWAEEYGIKSGTLNERLRRGIPAEKAITAPIVPPQLKRRGL